MIDLVRAVTSSGLSPVIDQVFDFEKAKDAFLRLQSGAHIGKVVIRVAVNKSQCLLEATLIHLVMAPVWGSAHGVLNSTRKGPFIEI